MPYPGKPGITAFIGCSCQARTDDIMINSHRLMIFKYKKVPVNKAIFETVVHKCAVFFRKKPAAIRKTSYAALLHLEESGVRI